MKNKKLFAILTLVCFMFTLMPVAAFADGEVITANGGTLASGTYKLTADIELTAGLTIPADAIVTIDLNGYTISYNPTTEGATYVINNLGSLTIQDSSASEDDTVGKGKITSSAANPDTATIPGYASNTVTNGGTLVVNSGTIENTTTNGSACYAIDTAWYSDDTNYSPIVTINGGKVTAVKPAIRLIGYSAEKTNKLIINGGVIEGHRAIWIQLPGSDQVNRLVDVDINGGSLTSTDETYNHAIYSYSFGNNYNGVNIDISDGTINGDVAIGGGSAYNGEGAETVTITGGTFDGDVYTYNSKTEDKISISGGTFTINPNDEYIEYDDYVVTGYEVVATGDGNYIVQKVTDKLVATGTVETTATGEVKVTTEIAGVYVGNNTTTDENNTNVDVSNNTLSIDTTSTSNTATSAEATLQQETAASLADNNASLEIKASIGTESAAVATVTFDNTALSTVSENAVKSEEAAPVVITIEPTTVEITTTDDNGTETKVEAVTAVSVEATVAGKNALPEEDSLENGTVTIEIPKPATVTTTTNVDESGKPYVYYVINNNGNMEVVSRVDAEISGDKIVVTTNHLSIYAVFTSEQETTSWNVTFKDGDKVVGTKTVVKGENITLPAAGSKDGYTFSGWKLDDTVYKVNEVYTVAADIIFVAVWEKNSSSSGGGFSGSYNYAVNAADVEDATVTFSKNYAVAGDTVTITVTPDAGKQVDEVIVTDADGDVITVTKVGDNQYSFIMPAGKVNVAVTTTDIDYDTKIVLQIGNKNVVTDNKTISNDVAPVIQGDRTLVPIRVIVEALGGSADWDEATRTVTLTIDGKVLTLVIDEEIPGFGQGATIMDSRTYVPIRYVAEYIGAHVDWIAATQQIVILK